MSNTINDGGPAFPYGQISEATGQPINGYFNAGMTLRDYFAGQALAGLYSSGDIDLAIHSKKKPIERQQLALMCYAVADDMLAAREAQP